MQLMTNYADWWYNQEKDGCILIDCAKVFSLFCFSCWCYWPQINLSRTLHKQFKFYPFNGLLWNKHEKCLVIEMQLFNQIHTCSVPKERCAISSFCERSEGGKNTYPEHFLQFCIRILFSVSLSDFGDERSTLQFAGVLQHGEEHFTSLNGT